MSRSISLRSVSLIAAVAIPLSLAAAPTVAADLAAARSEAVALRQSADNLMMLARTPMKYSSEAHATELARARSLTDRIGERVQRMNAGRAHATPAQTQQIDAMQGNLRAVAVNADVAIQTFNHRNGTADLYSSAYQTRVRNLYQDAKALATPVPAASTVAAD